MIPSVAVIHCSTSTYMVTFVIILRRCLLEQNYYILGGLNKVLPLP